MRLYELFEDWKSDLHVLKNLTRGKERGKDYDDDEDIPAIKSINPSQPSQPSPPIPEGQILVVRAPSGIEYFKSYKGRWYERLDKSETEFSVTHPISAQKDIASLEKMIGQGTRVYVTQSPTNHAVFTVDPVAEKREKLASLRKKPK